MVSGHKFANISFMSYLHGSPNPGSSIYSDASSAELAFNTRPGQPYKVDFNDDQVSEEIYKSLHQAQPADTQQVIGDPGNKEKVVLPNGMEVPLHIIKRDLKRKELARKLEEQRRIEAMPKPMLYPLGKFASEHPLKASLLAFLVGRALSKLV